MAWSSTNLMATGRCDCGSGLSGYHSETCKFCNARYGQSYWDSLEIEVSGFVDEGGASTWKTYRGALNGTWTLPLIFDESAGYYDSWGNPARTIRARVFAVAADGLLEEWWNLPPGPNVLARSKQLKAIVAMVSCGSIGFDARPFITVSLWACLLRQDFYPSPTPLDKLELVPWVRGTHTEAEYADGDVTARTVVSCPPIILYPCRPYDAAMHIRPHVVPDAQSATADHSADLCESLDSIFNPEPDPDPPPTPPVDPDPTPPVDPDPTPPADPDPTPPVDPPIIPPVDPDPTPPTDPTPPPDPWPGPEPEPEPPPIPPEPEPPIVEPGVGCCCGYSAPTLDFELTMLGWVDAPCSDGYLDHTNEFTSLNDTFAGHSFCSVADNRHLWVCRPGKQYLDPTFNEATDKGVLVNAASTGGVTYQEDYIYAMEGEVRCESCGTLVKLTDFLGVYFYFHARFWDGSVWTWGESTLPFVLIIYPVPTYSPCGVSACEIAYTGVGLVDPGGPNQCGDDYVHDVTVTYDFNA